MLKKLLIENIGVVIGLIILILITLILLGVVNEMDTQTKEYCIKEYNCTEENVSCFKECIDKLNVINSASYNFTL